MNSRSSLLNFLAPSLVSGSSPLSIASWISSFFFERFAAGPIFGSAVPSKGFIADTDCAIVYDYSHGTKVVLGHGDFGTTYSIADGLSLRLTSIVVNLG